MTNPIENEGEELDLETSEVSETSEKVKKAEIVPNIVTAKYTRPPAFQKASNFSRWNTQTNNRQRPGRAAWRGR